MITKKKMIFAGCSFTYGHGLWHYTKEEGLPKDDIAVYSHNFPKSIEFTKNNRFPRLVSNYFNSHEILKESTSGSDEISLYFIKELFRIKKPSMCTITRLNYDQVSHLIFQTSFLDRCNLYEGNQTLNIHSFGSNYKGIGISKEVASFWDRMKIFYFNEILNLFEMLEEKNIKCYMISMTDDYQDLIEKNEFIKKRFINIEYDGKSFNNFLSLTDYNKKLSIINDTDFFEDPPKDLHPTLEWHKTVADSIIKKLETDFS
jgi:hypothetical protein